MSTPTYAHTHDRRQINKRPVATQQQQQQHNPPPPLPPPPHHPKTPLRKGCVGVDVASALTSSSPTENQIARLALKCKSLK